MNCGEQHMDLFEDTSSGLELDRIKDKIRAIWQQIVLAQYSTEYKDQKDDDEDYVSKDDFLEQNALFFPGEDRPENEVDNLVEMLENMFNDKEELDPVSKEGKAPSYKGSELKANNEKGDVEVTTYEVNHKATSTPSDSKSPVKSTTYDKPSGGSVSTRKDSGVQRSYAPMLEKLVEQLLDLDERRDVGRRKQLFRL